MEIYKYDDYKKFARERIAAMPSGGRGQFRKIAQRLAMHTSLVSQVFNGDRHLSLEQACEFTDFWGLNPLESEMFLALVQRERAGSRKLKTMLDAQIAEIRTKAQTVTHRVPRRARLSESAQAIFYSNWYYSGLRLLTSIPGLHSVDALAARTGLARKKVAGVVDFLVAHGLCVKKNGEIQMGPGRTHLPAESPLITRHHLNWRLQGLKRMETLGEHELMFTAPLTIARKDAVKVREAILRLIDEVSKTVADSPSEKLACLNIEWFDV